MIPHLATPHTLTLRRRWPRAVTGPTALYATAAHNAPLTLDATRGAAEHVRAFRATGGT